MIYGPYKDEVIEVVNWGLYGRFVRTRHRLFEVGLGEFLKIRRELNNEIAGKDKRKK